VVVVVEEVEPVIPVASSTMSEKQPSSAQHLSESKQLPTVDDFNNVRKDEVNSDQADDGCKSDQEDVIREINFLSQTMTQEVRKITIHMDAPDKEIEIPLEKQQSIKSNKKVRDKEDAKSVEPPSQFLQHPGLLLKN
jgi:hypothetical protein